MKCSRNKTNCTPLDSIVSNCGTSFICVGFNKPEDRVVKGDRFTHCWKNDVVDDLSHWDRRDLIDTITVMSKALSIDENIKVHQKLTDEQMNETSFLPGPEEEIHDN